MAILCRQDDQTTPANVFGLPGFNVEVPCRHLAPAGSAWALREMVDHLAQAPDFDFNYIRDADTLPG
eukprot:9543663-Alexandrium_andersonii.AAC.1